MLTKQKTRAECHFDYQLELMQRLILSNDLFQKMFLIFTPQARNLIDYPKQKNVIYQKFMSLG